MTLYRRCAPILVFGCVSAKSLPPHPSTDDASVRQDVSLQSRVDMGQSWVSFVNAAVKEGASNPSDGAQFAYARAGSSNARVSPVDIYIRVEDEAGNPIHDVELDQITALYHQIYGWNPDAWSLALEGRMGSAEVVQTKSNFFWETLAQHIAERVFEEEITPPLLVYGPQCLDIEGNQHCSTDGIDEAHRVLVRTRIDGSRDPLNPATRTILYVAERGAVRSPEIILEIQIPTGLNVAGPESEYLDFRPFIAGQREQIENIRVLAHIPSGTRDRIRNTDYPDYSLLFVPLRHLVFQGEVANPKGPNATLSYSDTASLRQRFDEVIEDLRTVESAQSVVNELRPFMTTDYYYMFDQGEGVAGYRDYLLGPDGIGGGIAPDVGRVELILE